MVGRDDRRAREKDERDAAVSDLASQAVVERETKWPNVRMDVDGDYSGGTAPEERFGPPERHHEL